MNYQEYLRSDHWKTKREEMLDLCFHRCQRCGAEENLQVHHKNYKRLGKELTSDLEVLCGACHAIKHGKIPPEVRRTHKTVHISVALGSAFLQLHAHWDKEFQNGN